MMTKVAIGLVSLAFAFACGGDAQSWEEPEVTAWEFGESALDRGAELDDLGEVGSLEQAYSGAVTNNTQWGARDATSKDACDRTSTGQTCMFMDTKTLTYCADAYTGLGGTIDVRIPAVAALLDGQVNWTFVQATEGFIDPRCITYNVLFQKGPVGSVGTASNDIKDYVDVFWSGTTSLTETGVPAPKGNYKKANGCSIVIDELDILAKGANATEDQRLADHAIANGFLVCAGLGRSAAASTLNRGSRHAVNAGLSATGTSTAEQCKMNGYTATNDGNFSLPGNCGAD